MKVMKLWDFFMMSEWWSFLSRWKDYILTGTFLCFDPLVQHKATDINTTVKRIALDFTVVG